MLIVLPVCEKDYALAQRVIEHCVTLDNRVDYPALIIHERGHDVTALIDQCRAYFSTAQSHAIEPWTGDPSWPQGANWAWQCTSRHIENSKIKATHWLWLEPDAIPIKPGWLTTLVTAVQHGQRPFAGAITTNLGNTYMAGVGFYPPDISRHCQAALLTRTMPFDLVASTRDGTLRKTHDITPLICHNPLESNTHFTSMDDVARLIPESAVLYHKCKDGSLLDVLQGKTGPATPSLSPSPANLHNLPSFTEQTKWESGYFTFPAATNTVYFNPSLIEANGSLHLFTRRFRYKLEQVTSNMEQGNKSDLAIWRVRDNLSLSPSPILPTLPNRYPHEQWEDPRAMLGDDGYVYLGMATWVHHKGWDIRQSFARLSRDWRKIEPLWETAYGGNSPRPVERKQHEKNWIWFQRDNQWHCQYSINPGEVFKVDGQGNAVETYKVPEARHEWQCGLPLRGGTPPTRVGDEYIAFFHTSTVWQKPKRRYYMGAYTFDAEPPFALRRITPHPILVGSDQDFRSLGGPLVIFPAGAVLRDQEWLVVFGVNDEACGWLRIPHADLEEQLTPVKRSVMERLSLALT